MAKRFERDWQFLREAGEDLERYLLSPELYWPMAGLTGGRSQEGMLQFTLGNLELSRVRLSALDWTPEEQARLDELNEKIQAVHTRWKVNWSKKAGQEYSARLKLWSSFVTEQLGEQRHFSGYAFDVRWRAILQLLEKDIQTSLQGERDVLATLDARLQRLTEPGPFVWEPEVEPGFPRGVYWYLYVAMKP